jgi:hypothetical protein
MSIFKVTPMPPREKVCGKSSLNALNYPVSNTALNRCGDASHQSLTGERAVQERRDKQERLWHGRLHLLKLLYVRLTGTRNCASRDAFDEIARTKYS